MTRRLALASLGGLCAALALTGSAAPDPSTDSFSASITPAAVQALASGSYVLTITNDTISKDAANAATVTVPGGFTVDSGSLTASTSSAGSCTAATWTATLVVSEIELAPADPTAPANDLCPGGMLTLSFSATSASADGSYEWTTALLLHATAFALDGSQPAVTVDGTPPPAPTITSDPPDPSASSSAAFEFADSEAGVSFRCQLDGGGFVSCATGEAYSALADGSHTFSVEAVDEVGNVSPAASYTWTVDMTPPPAPTLTDKPPNVTAQTSASFAFDDADPNATFSCRLDSAVFASCTTPQPYSGLAAGSHTFQVKATDEVGNVGPVTSYTWVIDLTNPVVTIDPSSEPPDPTNRTGASFVFNSNKPGSTFACRLDGAAYSPCTSPQSYSGLTDGRHTFAVRATDFLGNTGLPTVWAWTVNTVVPPDTTGPVSHVVRIVHYGRMKLTWTPPSDLNFDHIQVVRTRSPKGAAGAVVYQGQRRYYVDNRFLNGTQYSYEIRAYSHSGKSSEPVAVDIPASILLQSPRDGSTVSSLPLFRWRPVRHATYYNFQLYFGRKKGLQKVMSAWPSAAKKRMTRSWSYGGRRFSLRKGSYQWYVWPGFGRRSRARYGHLLGTGQFRVG